MLALLSVAAATASGAPVELVYGISAQVATAKSAVPGGLPGVADARFTNFNNKLFRSPTTGRWVIVATTNATPPSADQVFLIGQGLTAAVAAQEGVTEFAPGQFLNFSGLAVPRINDAGRWAVAFRPAGGTTIDDKVVRWNGTAFEIVAQRNTPLPSRPSDVFSGAFNSATIANDGKVSFLGAISPFLTTTDSAFLGDGTSLVAEINVTAPTGQSPDTVNATWTDIDSDTLLTSADGMHWIALGEIGFNTAFDKVAVVDGAVVVQKGSVLAGSGFSSSVGAIGDVWMEPTGDWFVRGSNLDGIDWVIRNGALIAVEGQPVVPGSPLLWETFRSMRGDNRGNYVVNGNASGDTLSDDVIVVNGQRILAREADPIDADSNGTLDDGLYLHLIQDHTAFNTDGYVYFVSRLKSSPTANAGAAGSNNASLLRVFACPADINGSGAISVQDIFDFLSLYFANSAVADYNRSGAVSVQDIFDFLAGYFSGC